MFEEEKILGLRWVEDKLQMLVMRERLVSDGHGDSEWKSFKEWVEVPYFTKWQILGIE